MRRRTTAAAGVLFTAALSYGFSGTANAADLYKCEDFAYQEDAQAVYDQDTSDPHGLDGQVGPTYTGVQGVACEDLPRRGTSSAGSATPATATSTTTTSTTTGGQVSTRPAGAVAAGDGSSSRDEASALPYILGGVALTAAGGAAVAARRSSRTTV
jgi:hypothetical protein